MFSDATRVRTMTAGVLGLALALGGPAAGADGGGHDHREGGGRYCDRTAKAVLQACRAGVTDDYWLARARCINEPGRDERRDCEREAHDERWEAREECAEQFHARLEVCDLVGQERLRAGFDPDQFVHPDRIGVDVAPNPYYPLIPGMVWRYESEDETVTVTVTDRIKLIDGVVCRVLNDVVHEDGVLLEDTDDWVAQDVEGNIWYCGEIAQDFELFEGDDPELPELVSIDGSFKAGRDGDLPGILVPRHPVVGDAYRQEVSLGNAEDVAQVISITGSAVVPAASCDGNCLVTRDFTPLEPGNDENKYYAPGIGLILEVDIEGSRLELVEFFIP